MNDTASTYTLEEALDAGFSTTMGEIRDADMARQMETAKRNPRSLRVFLDKLTELCTLTDEVASSCTYSLPRGGKRVVGPSVRFAELVVAAYRNLHVSTTIIEVGDDAAVVRGAVIDLEANTLTEGDCRRVVQKKRGSSKPDEDMKQLAVASGSAIAYRNAVFKAVPRALWEPAWRESQKAATGKGTMEKRRQAALDLYAEFGATEDQVLRALGRKGTEEITQDDLRHLRGMVTAIRSGELTIDEALRPPEEDKPAAGGATRQSSAADKVARSGERNRRQAQPQPPAPTPDAEPPHDEETGDVHDYANLPDEYT